MILIEEMPKKAIKLFEVNDDGTTDIINDVYYQEAFYNIREKIAELENYQESGQWLLDYESDERGELPSDLKRGVLSEDMLYNLLCDVRLWK